MKQFPRSVLQSCAKSNSVYSMDLFTQLKAGVFLDPHENATHTLSCSSTNKTDAKKKIHHVLMNQRPKTYLRSQQNKAKSMIWN